MSDKNRHNTHGKLAIVGCKDNNPIILEEYGELSAKQAEARVAYLRTIQPPGTRIVVVRHDRLVALLESLPGMGAKNER